MRGADVLIKALETAGVERLFTLSGNQIMSVFDACIGSGIDLVHVRHEAAAVHMADAWGRLTDEPGVALVTAGPGFANTLSALYVARMAESPMVLLSGDAPIGLAGRGAFQEMAQADMSTPVTKASWTATDASRLGQELARALAVSRTGRPGPVHLALPVDLLESSVDDIDSLPPAGAFQHPTPGLDDTTAGKVLDALAEAQRPMVLTGPVMARGAGRRAASELADKTGVPVIPMESPRGVNDPSLGAFAEVLPQAGLVVLLGRRLDFGVQLGAALAPDCRVIHLDPETDAIDQTRQVLDDAPRLVLAETADPVPATLQLARVARGEGNGPTDWLDEVNAAVSHRPPEWQEVESGPDGPLHPVEVCGAVQELLDGAGEAVLISDGGEFGQWAQACVSAPTRLINGPSGAIGSSIPFALAARARFPNATVVTILGDGTFGFHPAEFDTAVRYGLPFVAVVGNDAAWNAEYQIQLREYGEDRLWGCELLPTRYDKVVEALGGHGEYVTSAVELGPALERAAASGLPACVNVSIGRHAAPMIRRGS